MNTPCWLKVLFFLSLVCTASTFRFAVGQYKLRTPLERRPVFPSALSRVSSITNANHVGDLDTTKSDINDQERKAKLQLVISGAPAAGKGTQCEFIKSQFGLVHISTGELFRTAMRDNTKLGKEVRAYMEAGKLVPDDIVVEAVSARLNQPDCIQRGWLLDGFPRTRAQADELLKLGHTVDCFILLDVPHSILLDRITGRRTDALTGKVYHLTHNPPNDKEIEHRLVQRSDDTADKLALRYADYERHVAAIRSCYADRTIVVDGSSNKATISQYLQNVLNQLKERKRRT